MVSLSIAKVLGWLRAGYPEGIPPQDYFPLLALLNRQLGPEELRQVADDLIENSQDPVTRTDIAVAVNKVTNQLPSEADVDRVAARLAKVGYPVVESPEDKADAQQHLSAETVQPSDS